MIPIYLSLEPVPHIAGGNSRRSTSHTVAPAAACAP